MFSSWAAHKTVKVSRQNVVLHLCPNKNLPTYCCYKYSLRKTRCSLQFHIQKELCQKLKQFEVDNWASQSCFSLTEVPGTAFGFIKATFWSSQYQKDCTGSNYLLLLRMLLWKWSIILRSKQKQIPVNTRLFYLSHAPGVTLMLK